MILTQVIVGGASDSRLISMRRNDEPQMSATPLSNAHSTGPKAPSRDPWAVDNTGLRPEVRKGCDMRRRRVAGLTDVHRRSRTGGT